MKNNDIAKSIEQQFGEIVDIILQHKSNASRVVNEELLLTAWHVGGYVSAKLRSEEWGSKVVSQLSEYIRSQRPDLKGYSKRSCRNKAESFEEFIFLMEKLGYEVNVGAHISVKAEGMRRSMRLDTLDEEFSVRNLQNYYEQERPYKYVEPPVYHLGYALHKKPANAFQQRYYGKLYRMCVVQKCRFQYKYTRYQQDLIRMKELQEEYIFVKRESINGWEDVFRAK